MKVGDPLDAQTNVGPVVSRRQRDRIEGYLAAGLEAGARAVCGGGRPKQLEQGWYIEPTVFAGVNNGMKIAREEIFGPVLAIMTVRTFEDAVAVANGVAYGLSSSIFTNDLKRALAYLERAEVGLAHVNLMSAYKEPQLEFGGVKESGAGLPEAGSSGVEFFTHHKVCYVKYR
jgi:betaine-aldehyde dehydrogenase